MFHMWIMMILLSIAQFQPQGNRHCVPKAIQEGTPVISVWKCRDKGVPKHIIYTKC